MDIKSRTSFLCCVLRSLWSLRVWVRLFFTCFTISSQPVGQVNSEPWTHTPLDLALSPSRCTRPPGRTLEEWSTPQSGLQVLPRGTISSTWGPVGKALSQVTSQTCWVRLGPVVLSLSVSHDPVLFQLTAIRERAR